VSGKEGDNATTAGSERACAGAAVIATETTNAVQRPATASNLAGGLNSGLPSSLNSNLPSNLASPAARSNMQTPATR